MWTKTSGILGAYLYGSYGTGLGNSVYKDPRIKQYKKTYFWVTLRIRTYIYLFLCDQEYRNTNSVFTLKIVEALYIELPYLLQF